MSVKATLTTWEAAQYLGYKNKKSVYRAVAKGWISPLGGAISAQWLFAASDLDTLAVMSDRGFTRHFSRLHFAIFRALK